MSQGFYSCIYGVIDDGVKQRQGLKRRTGSID